MKRSIKVQVSYEPFFKYWCVIAIVGLTSDPTTSLKAETLEGEEE